MSRLAVLCIDDEEMILEALAMELEPHFPEIELTLLDNQAEAEEVVEELAAAGIEVAVIVCDYIMPGRRGDEVLACLHARLPDARTVMLTGQSSLDGVTNAINRAGLFRYLAKPWAKEDLRLTLKAALDSFRQEREIQRTNLALKELNESLERKVEERTRDLVQAHEKIREYVELIDQNVLISRIDQEGKILSVSEAFCQRYGYTSAELIGKNYWKTLHSRISDEQVDAIKRRIRQGETWEGELEHVARDGRRCWIQELISPNAADGALIVGFTSILQDITDRKVVERMSITDALTGLYNRRHFDAMLGQRIMQLRRSQEHLALYMIDIDHFKAYNDHYGHAAGDDVLRRLGNLLMERCDGGDGLAFRVGGEEFALLMNFDTEAAVRRDAERLQEAVNALGIRHEASPAGGDLTISIGIALVRPGVEPSADTLYRLSDSLLYQAKRAGRHQVAIEVMKLGA